MGEQTQQWRVGEATVTAITEAETAGIPPQLFFPDATTADVRACAWLDERTATANGDVTLRVQAFLIQLPTRTVLVDPCVGNSKRRALPFWNLQTYPWMERFRATGVTPEDIEVVVHTHLHADHVGWDTHLADGAWVPTFPNARHVYVGDELDYLQSADRSIEDVYGDSVAPIIDAGLADVVDVDTTLGDGLQLVATPGHTPGHTSLLVSSGDERLVITGDLMFHPVQFMYPTWSEIADDDVGLARETRAAFIDEHEGTDTLVAGSHFPVEPVGHVTKRAGRWRFEAVAGDPEYR